jgi:hypothetical protein
MRMFLNVKDLCSAVEGVAPEHPGVKDLGENDDENDGEEAGAAGQAVNVFVERKHVYDEWKSVA